MIDIPRISACFTDLRWHDDSSRAPSLARLMGLDQSRTASERLPRKRPELPLFGHLWGLLMGLSMHFFVLFLVHLGLHQRHNPGQLLSRTFTKPERNSEV